MSLLPKAERPIDDGDNPVLPTLQAYGTELCHRLAPYQLQTKTRLAGHRLSLHLQLARMQLWHNRLDARQLHFDLWIMKSRQN